MDLVVTALCGGNLPELNEEQRIELLGKCATYLNLPAGLPYFNFFNDDAGMLKLAIKKVGIQAIRKIRNISVDSSTPMLLGDVITFTVTGNDLGNTGRREAASGSVSLENLSGVDKAKAFMAAETKALRRLTMALAGINLPETEEMASALPVANLKLSAVEGNVRLNVTVSNEPAETFEGHRQTSPFPPLTEEQKEAGQALQRMIDAGKTIAEPGPAIGKIQEQLDKQETPITEALPKPKPVVEEAGGFGSMFDEEPTGGAIPPPPTPYLVGESVTESLVPIVKIPPVMDMPTAQEALDIIAPHPEPSLDPKPNNVEFKAFTARCTKLVRDILPKAGKDVPNLLLPYLKKTWQVKEIQHATIKQWETTLSAIENAGTPQAMAKILKG